MVTSHKVWSQVHLFSDLVVCIFANFKLSCNTAEICTVNFAALHTANYPDSKVHGANMGPTRPMWAPCWPREPCCVISKFSLLLDPVWTVKGVKSMPLFTHVSNFIKTKHSSSVYLVLINVLSVQAVSKTQTSLNALVLECTEAVMPYKTT